jgi:catechol-2,3-dioxygenase
VAKYKQMKIQQLSVNTPNLGSQLDFYSKTLGLPVSNQTKNHFSIQIGYSTLEFHQHENAKPYHIAFHIGANRENDALKWLERKQIPVLEDEGKPIVDFPAWNAKSVYFYDADQNIIEFISRKHLFPQQDGFSEKSLCGIAEIGLATTDVEENFRFLNRYFNLETYFGNPNETFCAIGDENGLFITVDKNKKTWFPTDDQAQPADFDVKFTVNEKLFELRFENGKLLGM